MRIQHVYIIYLCMYIVSKNTDTDNITEKFMRKKIYIYIGNIYIGTVGTCNILINYENR